VAPDSGMSEPHPGGVAAGPAAEALRSAARAVEASKVYGEGDTAVRALDDVTVEFGAARFSAVMGPSGSGKSTLMHCLAGLDQLSSGHAYVGDADLTTMSEKQLTLLRRDRIGFIFQAFNLVPTLSGRENVTLPLDIAGRKPDEQWLERIVRTLGIEHRMDHASSPAGSSSGSPRRARSSGARRSSSPTNRPGTSTPSRAESCSGSCARR
jgi:putative ABC transport system ATP-binding protein